MSELRKAQERFKNYPTEENLAEINRLSTEFLRSCCDLAMSKFLKDQGMLH